MLRVPRRVPIIVYIHVYQHPTVDCNWVIPRKLIAGAYPGGSQQDRDDIAAIIDAGRLLYTVDGGSLCVCFLDLVKGSHFVGHFAMWIIAYAVCMGWL